MNNPQPCIEHPDLSRSEDLRVHAERIRGMSAGGPKVSGPVRRLLQKVIFISGIIIGIIVGGLAFGTPAFLLFGLVFYYGGVVGMILVLGPALVGAILGGLIGGFLASVD